MRAQEFDQCYQQANDLYTKAKSQGRQPVMLQVAGFQGDAELADARWQKIPPRYWHHYVVVLDNTVYDPSAKQFGMDQTQYAVGKLGRIWDKVYKVK